MGSLTRTQLLSAGLGKAGSSTNNAALLSRVTVDFQAWLDRQYAGWSWPFLKKRAAGLSLSQGATSFTIGAGSGGVTREIIKLKSPIALYSSDRTTRGKAEIVQSDNASLEWDETLQDSATWTGQPLMFKARHGSVRGSWDLVPMPFPDRALLLAIDYYERPAVLGASDIPIYPDDETLINAIASLALIDQKGMADPNTQTMLGEAQAMVARDRSTYGNVPGENDMLRLDSSVFK